MLSLRRAPALLLAVLLVAATLQADTPRATTQGSDGVTPAQAFGDLNGDGNDDVLLRHTDGRWYYYPMNGRHVLPSGRGGGYITRSLDWQFAGLGDLNGDGNDDVLLRRTTDGRWYYYPMDGRRTLTDQRGGANIVSDLNWQLAGIGDLNGDGKDDVLMRHTDGRWYYYPMNGRHQIRAERGTANLTTDPDWQLAGLGDLNGDGRDDVLLRHTDGRWYYYPMNGREPLTEGRGPAYVTASLNWQFAGLGDLNGDGNDDVLLRRSTDGGWYYYPMNGRRTLDDQRGSAAIVSDLNWQLAGMGDLNGDGRDDVLLRHNGDNRWLYYPMNGRRHISTGRGIAYLTTDADWGVAGTGGSGSTGGTGGNGDSGGSDGSDGNGGTGDSDGNGGNGDTGSDGGSDGTDSSDGTGGTGGTGGNGGTGGSGGDADGAPVGNDDHSDARSGASGLSPGGSVTGQIDPGGDVDYFFVQVNGPGTLTLYTTGSLDTLGELQDSAGTKLAEHDDTDVNTNRNFRIEHTVSAGSYYVKVESYRTNTGEYTIHAKFSGSSGNGNNDGNGSNGGTGGNGGSNGSGEDDHSDTSADATGLSLGGSATGQIDPGNDADYFVVQIREPGILAVYTTGSLDTTGELQNSSGSTLASGDDSEGDTNFRIENRVSSGTYYIKVESYGSNTGSYIVNATLSVRPEIYNDNLVILSIDGLLAEADSTYLYDYTRIVYEWFDDVFDYILFFMAGDHIDYFGVYGEFAPVSIDTQGIGKTYDYFNPAYGSAGKLRGALFFPYDRALLYGPSLHELMHDWANYVVSTGWVGHWGFSSANGQLGGFDLATLVDLGDGRYTTTKGFGPFANNGNSVPYSEIELYLAGLLAPEEVPDLRVGQNARWLLDENDSLVTSEYGTGIFTAESFKVYTIDDIIAENGPRIPDWTQSQKHFQAMAVLLVDQNHPVSAEQKQSMSEQVSTFSYRGYDQSDLFNYYEATGGRGSITMDGLSRHADFSGNGGGSNQPSTLPDSIVPEVVSVPGGSFRMGDLSGDGDDNERPAHSVTVKPFKLGKYEVTFAQWDACAADGGCGGYRPNDYGWGRGNQPVLDVSWDDAQLYIDWLNSKTGGGYRLPTEAEWEYAARAGSTTKYSWGNDIGNNRANCSECGDRWGGAAPVGSFAANAWGLHDMHGNVWEWVEDCWHDNYDGAPGHGGAWISGGNCQKRVVRGGSWYPTAWYLRSAYRNDLSRTYRGDNFGFRVAQDN